MLSSSSLSFIFVAGALAAAPAAPAAAVSQVLFAPSFPVLAYPLASAGDVTTYLVGCTAGSSPKTCDFAQPYTLVQGSSTAQFTMSVPGQGAATVGCALQDHTSMACVATGAVVTAPASVVTASTTVVGQAAETHFRAVSLVTAAADLLTYPIPTTTPPPSTTTTTTTHTTHTTHNSTTTAYKTTGANSTSAYPTTSVGTASTTTASASASSSPTTIPNAGMLSSSSSLGAVFGAAAAVGAFFLAGVL